MSIRIRRARKGGTISDHPPGQHDIKVDFSAIIMNYTPTSIQQQVWGEIRDFVQGVVLDLEFDAAVTAVDTLRNTLSIVAQFTAWVWVQFGVLDRSAVFHPNVIGDYFESSETRSLTRRTAGTQRSLLMRVGEQVNPKWNADFQHPISYEPALQPYDPHDIRRFMEWADNQPSQARVTNMHTVLALCLGAGLRAGEICTLRVRDVSIDSQGVLVMPYGYRGADPRQVPLHVDFHNHIIKVIGSLEPEDYLFRPGRTNEHVGQLSSYLHRTSPRSSAEVPDTRRLRNTWIVRRILSGAPVDVICAAAGLRSLHQFERWVVEAGKSRAEQYRFLLQGGNVRAGPSSKLFVVRD